MNCFSLNYSHILLFFLTDKENARVQSTPSYQIKWNKMSDTTMKLMKAGKALTNNQINSVVYRVVEDVVENVSHVNRKFFQSIATLMIRQFPNAFSDIVVTAAKAKRLTTYGKLVYKLKNRYDNSKRKAERTRLQIEAPPRPEAYGCQRWQVLDMPQGETIETLKEKEERLKDIYETGVRNWDWNKIKELMTSTYILQRRLINSQFIQRRGRRGQNEQRATTGQIQDQYPLLFTYKGMTLHFKLLTNVHFQLKVESMMNEASEDLMDFLVTKQEANTRIKRAMKDAVKNDTCQDPQLTALVLMVIRTLKEKFTGLIQIVQVCMIVLNSFRYLFMPVNLILPLVNSLLLTLKHCKSRFQFLEHH